MDHLAVDWVPTIGIFSKPNENIVENTLVETPNIRNSLDHGAESIMHGRLIVFAFKTYDSGF